MPFDSATASIAGSIPKQRQRQRTPYQVAIDIQRRIADATDSEDVTGPALAQLARAWSELEERKRVMRMKPAPKPIDTTINPRSKARQPRESFSEGPNTNKLDTPKPSPYR